MNNIVGLLLYCPGPGAKMHRGCNGAAAKAVRERADELRRCHRLLECNCGGGQRVSRVYSSPSIRCVQRGLRSLERRRQNGCVWRWSRVVPIGKSERGSPREFSNDPLKPVKIHPMP